MTEADEKRAALAEWLDDNRYVYMSASMTCCGPTLDFDHERLATDIFKWFAAYRTLTVLV